MIILVSDPEEMVKYRKLINLTSGCLDCPALPLRKDLFGIARGLFDRGACLIAVLGDEPDFDKEDKCIFYLINREDTSSQYGYFTNQC